MPVRQKIWSYELHPALAQTATTSGTSVIASGNTFAPTHGFFRYLGCQILESSTHSGWYEQERRQSGGFSGYSSSQNEHDDTPWSVLFATRADEIELYLKGESHTYDIFVDGKILTDAAISAPTGTTEEYHHFDFTSEGARLREFRIDFHGENLFGGIVVGPTYTIEPSSVGYLPRVVVAGDSFSVGANSEKSSGVKASQRGCCYAAGTLMGWDTMIRGYSSSGYAAENSSQGPALSNNNRVDNEIIAEGLDGKTLDAVWLPLGHNDSIYSNVTPVFDSQIQRIRNALPNVPIIISGPWQHALNGSNPTMVRAETNMALKKRAAGIDNCYFVDVIGGGWITGDTAVASSGNANLFQDSGTVHPNILGHVYLGNRLAGGIDQSLRKTPYFVSEKSADKSYSFNEVEFPSYIQASDWGGASGGTQPSGWSDFGTLSYTVADHDGETNALRIENSGINNNLFRTFFGSSYGGYNNRVYRIKFKIKVVDGRLILIGTGGAFISGVNSFWWQSIRHKLTTETDWNVNSNMPNLTAGFLMDNSFAPSWTDVEVDFVPGRPGLSLSSNDAGANDYYLNDFSICLLTRY